MHKIILYLIECIGSLAFVCYLVGMAAMVLCVFWYQPFIEKIVMFVKNELEEVVNNK